MIEYTSILEFSEKFHKNGSTEILLWYEYIFCDFEFPYEPSFFLNIILSNTQLNSAQQESFKCQSQTFQLSVGISLVNLKYPVPFL